MHEALAGGPAPEGDLLEAQYTGAKVALRPVHDRLVGIATGLGPDVSVVVQETGVSLRRRRQFGVVQAPSAARVQLGLNLEATPDDLRVVATSGMCSHRVDLPTLESVDGDIERWMTLAYEQAG